MTKMNAVEVLRAEDNSTTFALPVRALERQGFVNDIFHAEDGEEALGFVLGRAKSAEHRTLPAADQKAAASETLLRTEKW